MAVRPADFSGSFDIPFCCLIRLRWPLEGTLFAACLGEARQMGDARFPYGEAPKSRHRSKGHMKLKPGEAGATCEFVISGPDLTDDIRALCRAVTRSRPRVERTLHGPRVRQMLVLRSWGGPQFPHRLPRGRRF